MTQTYTGACLCGQITYTATGPPVIVARCHCNACRRTSGTGHSTGAMFPAAAVTVNGTTAAFTYTADTGSQVTKTFCPTCGSPIHGRNTRLTDHITLSLGTMDDTTGLNVAVSIFTRDRPHWDELGPDAMIFDTQPDWTPQT